MQISKNFTLTEVLASDTARQRGISNNPTPEHTINLVRIIDNCLQRVRDNFGAPVTITSGYRSAALNRAVGGAINPDGTPKSQHCFGQAIDFTVRGKTVDEVIAWCRKNLVFDQLIHEKNSWVHISYVHNGNNRKQVLKTADGVKFTAM